MKKAFFLIITFLLLGLIGCQENIELSLETKIIELTIGDSCPIEYSSNGEVEINVVDQNIVILEENIITAIADGETTIVLTVKGTKISMSIEVIVSTPRELEIVALEEAIYVNKTYQLEINSLYPYQKNQLIWSSSDQIIAKVNGEGRVNTYKAGEVTITAESPDDETIFAEITLIVEAYKITIEPITSCYIGESTKLNFSITPANNSKKFTFESSDEEIATIDQYGNIECLGSGTVKFTVRFADNVTLSAYTFFTVKEKYSLEICCPSSDLLVGNTITLETLLTPHANKSFIWTVSNEKIAYVRDNTFTFLTTGEVIITATLKDDPNVFATTALVINLDPIKLMEYLNVNKPYAKNITTFGYNPDTREQMVYGSVTEYFFSTLNLIEKIVPINANIYAGQTATPAMLEKAEPMKLVRPGIYLEQIKHIIYHDTGNHTPNANGLAHANYLVSADNANNRARSWHYTVDENCVYYHIPDNEVTWQGDSYIAYGQSIGIETCVDFGSDLETTWHRTAKLMAILLLKYNLTPADIRQHYDMNGKDCPRALRNSNMYNYAIDLVIAEYMVLKNLSEYEISMVSHNPTYVDNRGRVILLPEVTTEISYTVTVKNNNDYEESIILKSNLNAK